MNAYLQISQYAIKEVLLPIFSFRRALSEYDNFNNLLANRKNLFTIFSTWPFMPISYGLLIFQKMSISGKLINFSGTYHPCPRFPCNLSTKITTSYRVIGNYVNTFLFSLCLSPRVTWTTAAPSPSCCCVNSFLRLQPVWTSTVRLGVAHLVALSFYCFSLVLILASHHSDYVLPARRQFSFTASSASVVVSCAFRVRKANFGRM